MDAFGSLHRQARGGYVAQVEAANKHLDAYDARGIQGVREGPVRYRGYAGGQSMSIFSSIDAEGHREIVSKEIKVACKKVEDHKFDMSTAEVVQLLAELERAINHQITE